jgi:LacI family transcriptional regulator
MAQSITAKDVAQTAEVSVGTVSRVFNNHTNVPESTRQRVLKAASELGYYGPGTGNKKGSQPRAVKEIGFLYSPLHDAGIVTANPFWSHILAGVEHATRTGNLRLTYRTISTLREDPNLLLTTIYEMRVGGLLLVGPIETSTIRAIQSTQLPLVLVESFRPRLNIDCVGCDSFDGACQAVEYLVELGHREIAFIGGPAAEAQPQAPIYSVEQRALGYESVHHSVGLPVKSELRERGDMTTEGGYAACLRLLKRAVPFTALFCANDMTALGAIKALREFGRDVPGDVSVIGFDDVDLAEHLTPALTTVRVPKERIGDTAVKVLMARVSEPDAAFQTTLLAVDLVKRGSVRAL